MAIARSVAIIGAGPAGAITVDALAQEKAFDVIKVFERRSSAGGCWLQDPPENAQQLPDLERIAKRNPDATHPIPSQLPVTTPKSTLYRFSETSIYPYLETNIDVGAMSFSQEPIPDIKSEISVQRHGKDTPFRHWKVIENYIVSLLDRNGYQDLVTYDTTVELVSKVSESGKWRLVLRNSLPGSNEDFWWSEDFDAIIVASGHYTVPFIPHTNGLAEFIAANPGSVEHSKAFRGRDKYTGKRVVVVGASISGPDISSDLCGVAQTPIISCVRGRYHPYFSDHAFQNPHIQRRSAISRLDSQNGARTVHFEDGSFVEDVDHIIFATGYTWTLHMLPNQEIRNNRVPGLYQHIFNIEDPTLLFVGAIAAGFTFKVFEWQAVLAARFLAGRFKLPSVAEQKKWEDDRVAVRGDGVQFTALYPKFEEYFEEVRRLAGEPVVVEGKGLCGRRLPKFEMKWVQDFERGHLKRIEMWKARNREAEEKLRVKVISADTQKIVAKESRL